MKIWFFTTFKTQKIHRLLREAEAKNPWSLIPALPGEVSSLNGDETREEIDSSSSIQIQISMFFKFHLLEIINLNDYHRA